MVVGETIGDTVYWCRPRYLQNGKPQISSFDTVSEAFRLLPPPPVSLAEDELVDMIDMHGTPAVWTMTELHLDVWALDEDERWVRRLRVEMPPPPAPLAYWSKGSRKNAVATFESGDGGVQMVVVTWAWKLLYDDTSKDRRVVGRTIVPRHSGHFWHTNCWFRAYRESLVRVESCTPDLPPDGEPYLQFC